MLRHALGQALSSASTQVGGNIGIETKRLRALYPDIHMHVFEPLGALAKLLQRQFAVRIRIRIAY
jgi:hypothetical protein